MVIKKCKKTKQKKDLESKDHKLRDDDLTTKKKRNSKAFAINATKSAERRFKRKQDLDEKRHHIPLVDRTPLEPPPVVVAVVGPPKVGKTTLIKSLVKHYTKHGISQANGPITIVSAKKRRLTLVECNNDIHGMVDIAKIADLVLILVDASFGFEVELFEFLNICQSHGMPKIIGVLTHLDQIKNQDALKQARKSIKKRFWNEIYKGSKLFCVSGLMHNIYSKNDTQKIARHLSVIKFRPLTWQSSHPYLLVDRIEDLTDQGKISNNKDCDRRVSMYGYVRGNPFKTKADVHIPGCGDFKLNDITKITDPCPLSKSRNERVIYAPFSGVGGVICDKDAVYIDLAGSQSVTNKQPSDKFTDELKNSASTMFDKLEKSTFKVLKEDSHDVKIQPQKQQSQPSTNIPAQKQLNVTENNAAKNALDLFSSRQQKNMQWLVYSTNLKPVIDHDLPIDGRKLQSRFITSKNSNGDTFDENEYDSGDSYIDYEKQSSLPANDINNSKISNGESDDGKETDDSDLDAEELKLKKMRKKSQFDQLYDTGGLEETEEKTFYQYQKEKLQVQSTVNQSLIEGLDEDVRLEVEGYRAGLYVRVEFMGIPSILIENFDPSYPLIVGGINPGELGQGYNRVRIKKHRWYKRLLKTKDPLIISMGWRRFQTSLVYHVMDDNKRNRALKYTPWHLHCLATFWGPIVPPGTGFVAFQETDVFTKDFRIAATGVVLDLDKDSEIEKKLKLVGTPMKVLVKSAFIQGMFNSELEATNFEGAEIRTVSGIRGIIKKAVKYPEGTFRATFEDKILMSDIVFMKTWFRVEVPKFYITAKTLLMPKDDRTKWLGARTTGRIRFEEGIKASDHANPDSIYKPIERKQFTFKPFIIPRRLQKELPFSDKPKFLSKDDSKIEHVAAIKGAEEKRRIETLAMMTVLDKQRELKYKEQRIAKKGKYIERVEKKSKKYTPN